ncbi:MAG: nitrilase-related carbon-nitrogen hydrolase [Wujia sp.]
MKIGISQLDIVFEDKEATKTRCMSIAQEAANEGVRLLVFPEMTLTGFTMQPQKVGDGKEDIAFFREISHTYHMAVAFGYIFPGENGGYENRMAIVEEERILLDYAKIHPFSYSGEHLVYQPGGKVAQAIYENHHFAANICYDLRFPEIFSALRQTVDTYIVIANWPKQRIAQWEALLRARAIENQAYVVGVNRCGEGNGLYYPNSSHVYNWLGEEISSPVSGQLLVAELDREAVLAARSAFPQEADRRNALYRSIL